MKKAAIIYHRIDFDGICSYAIIRSAFENAGYEAVPFPYNRGDEAPSLAVLAAFDAVVIADIALPYDTMSGLLGLAEGCDGFLVEWIDHHKTTIEDSCREGFDRMNGLRRIGSQGACELCWERFYAAEPPRAVKLLSAYDTWDRSRFDWEEETLPFQYGMRQRYALRADEFLADFWALCSLESLRSDIVRDGRAILAYARESGGKGVKSYGFEVTVGDGHRAVCCLTSQFGGLAFEEALRDAGAAIAVCANRLSEDLYNVAMYGIDGVNDLDLGAYLHDNYGGGGHRNAAGARIDAGQFIRLITECRI